MNFNAHKEAVPIYKEIFSGNVEQPIDLDVTLPDYCPDITRILKCQIIPQVTSRQITGDRLNIEGATLVRILYQSENHAGVRCCELSSPFSRTFNLKTIPDMPSVFTTFKVDFVNCRAVTRRRIDIHGAFTVCIKVLSKTEEEYLNDAVGAGMMLKRKNIPVSSLLGAVQQVFSLSETVQFPKGKRAAEMLIRFDSAAFVDECKIIADKAMVKGYVKVTFLYLTDAESGDMETMEYSLPFNQIVDIYGLNGECVCNTALEIMSTQVQLNQRVTGEESSFEVEIRACLYTAAYKQRMLTLIIDAYSTEYEIESERKQIEMFNLADCLDEIFEAKTTVSAEAEKVVGIIDAWCENINHDVSVKDGKLNIGGRASIGVLLSNSDQTVTYLEAPVDFILTKVFDGADGLQADCTVNVLSIGFKMVGSKDELEIKLELKCTGQIESSVLSDCLTEIEPNEEKGKERDMESAITIYYAQPDETVWDIAKSYNTSEEAIRSENNIASETVGEHKALLIPAI